MKMFSRILALSTGFLVLWAAPAGAAEVTDIPPWLRGDISVDYDFSHLAGSLYENDTEVGTRAWENHLLTYSIVFSGGPGVAAFLEIPQYASSRISFPEAHEMVFDPSSETGTMVDTDLLEDAPIYKGSGLGGLWFGIRGTPFSEAFERRGNLSTWLVEAALQTEDQTHFYTLTNGARGAGPGGSGLRLHTAFSTFRDPAEPYMEATWIRRGTYTTDLYDDEGNVLASDQEMNPADRVRIRAGTELQAYENPISDAFFHVDLRLGFGYDTWQTLPSGLLLPSVLSSSLEIPVTESEYTTLSAGLGFYYRAFRYMQFNVVADLAYLTWHQLEHPYPIYSGPDTVEFSLGTELKVMIR